MSVEEDRKADESTSAESNIAGMKGILKEMEERGTALRELVIAA